MSPRRNLDKDIYNGHEEKLYELPRVFIPYLDNIFSSVTHGAEENVHLWSLRFEPKGPIFELWLEDTLHIKPDIDDKLDALPHFLKFFWSMKCRLAESILDFAQLKNKHTKYLVENRFNNITPSDGLSTTVNPSILKLLEEDDKTGMHLLGPFIVALPFLNI
ncbi:MAG: hypothetical protein EXX96DRAFT_608234 [Benjaminiella poitrasii]|nr:MAG: hypothetical protein EXX96DRAFT_608234 [Benjaminiella poitrasii]